MIRPAAAVLAFLIAVATIAPAGADDEAVASVIGHLRQEEQQRSAVMDTLSWLADVYGPRLTGSPNLRRAAEWARDRLSAWGLQNAALEPVPGAGRGWVLDRFSIEMTAPDYLRITGDPRAWSPPIAGALTGTPVLVDVATPADFDKYRGRLRGAIVMNGGATPDGIGFAPEATRLSDDELRRMRAETNPTAPGYDESAPKSFADDVQGFRKSLAIMSEVWRFFAQEGVGAVITPSSIAEAVRVEGFYDRNWRSPYPAFVISREEYGRIARMLARKVPVTLELSLTSRFVDQAEAFNVIAEIAGTDPRLKDEIVMVGAHLDSWHAGTGATDNAAGCAAVLEAVRLLTTVGVKPRRTIRVALWTGEEQDYLGSLGYVRAHFGDPDTLRLKPEQKKVSAYFNLDTGAGRIRGIDLQGNGAARALFETWFAPLRTLGVTTVSILNTGGTDHMPFDGVGIPAFTFIQDPLNYDTRTHHSSLDVYDEVLPDDLQQMAVVVAGVVYQAAMRDQMVPRKLMPEGK